MTVNRALSYGEVSPSLQKRVDLDSYARSAKTVRNWKVKREGGVETRPGTKLSAPVKYSINDQYDCVVRPFIFNSDDANVYALEIGHQYIRFHKNGEQIRLTGQAITGISNASVGIVTYTGADPTNGDEVYISGVFGMPEVNGRWYHVANVNGVANTFELTTTGDVNVNTSTFGTWTSGGTFEKPYEITTGYDGADVRYLSLSQLNDVIVIAGGGATKYYPQTLTRSSDTSWTLADISLRDYDSHVYGLSGTAGSAGSKTFKYKVSYVPYGSSKESLPGTETSIAISGITNASPAVVTCPSHGYSNGDRVIIKGVSGMDEINGREFEIEVTDPGAYVPDTPISVFGITRANPMVISKNSHGLADGDKIVFSITGMTELNDITYGTVTSRTANTFQVYYFGTTTKIDSTGFQAFTGGSVTRLSINPSASNEFTLKNIDSTNYGVFSNPFGDAAVARTHTVVASAADPSSSAPHVITWTGISSGDFTALTTSGAGQYVIYREVNGVYGYIGVTPGTVLTFSDVGVTPDTGDGPFRYADLWQDEDDYPYCVAFGKQRLIFGGSNNNPNRVLGSCTGDYYNFSTHEISTSSDAITLDLLGSQRMQIVRSMKEISGRVIAFCSDGEFGIGDDDGTIDATAPAAKQFSSWGSTTLPAMLISNVATYVQARSSQVRDLGYSFEENGYRGEERSIRSAHLFKGHSITDWCYQQVPDSIIWAVRDDGVLLGCTYVREQQMAAWHRHDWKGSEVSSVACVPGDSEDTVYLVVNRTTPGGSEFKTVEVMTSRRIDDIVESTFTDSTVISDLRNTDAAYLLRLQGGTTYAAGEPMTLHASHAGTFTGYGTSLIGQEVHLTFTEETNGVDLFVRCTVTGYTNGTTLTVTPDKAIPALAQVEYTQEWSYGFFTIHGLWHLEGETVSVLGDGFVEGSALNDGYATYTVSSGSITLANAYAYVSVGLPITCDLELLDIDSAQAPGGGLIHRSKMINKMYVAVEETRGLLIGSAPPDDDDTDPMQNLSPLDNTVSNTVSYDDPPELVTDILEQDNIGNWDSHGRCFIRQIDPLPATVLAVMPEGSTGI